MHEMTLAKEICEIALDHVTAAEAPRIVAVGLQVGIDSGVEPESLRFWLETFLESPPFGSARPLIERVPGDVFRVTHLEVDDVRPDH